MWTSNAWLRRKDWRLPQPNFSGHTVERNWVTVLPNDTETEPFAFFLRNGQRWRLIFDTRTVSSETRGAAGIGTLPTPSEEDLDVEGPPRDGTTHVCVCGTRTSTEQCCSNMSASNVRVHRLNIPSKSVTLHVSRVSALPTLWPMLSFGPFSGEASVGYQLATTYVLQTYLSLVVRKRQLVISLATLFYVHCCTLISLTTRTRMVADRNAVRFGKEQVSRKYMTRDAGERSSCVPGWDGEADTYFSYARRARQFVEGPRIQRKGLFAVPDLRLS